jgi:CopA family copper-resistance protein
MKSPLSISPLAALSRRRFVLGAASACVASALPSIAGAQSKAPAAPAVLTDTKTQLTIGSLPVNFTGKSRMAVAVNQSLPAPILRWREGDSVEIAVRNDLRQDSSIHWHGIILPSEMDGVPGLSFAGIKPGETFTYRFKLNQSGTYWYHSHSHFQEQLGLYGAIIIDPQTPEPEPYDRDMVILLSDWSDTLPEKIQATLKKQSHYYNNRERTVGDTRADIRKKGVRATWSDRAMWNQMRMSDRDLADVTAPAYTYLMNGVTPGQGWTGVFEKGERLRLRIINGSAMTLFDVRIPGLKMRVVAADGQNVRPVEVDEFRIGVAETYDVIVEPENRAYTLFAQSIDRTGYARGTLTPDPAWQAAIPPLDPAPVLTHRDMGMGHGESPGDHSHVAHRPVEERIQGGDHSAHDHHAHQAAPVAEPDHSDHHDHSAHQDHAEHAGHAEEHDHSAHQGHDSHLTHREVPAGPALAPAGFGANFGDPAPVAHVATEFGPHVDMRVEMPASGIADPGVGLRDHARLYDRKVLTYADLRSLHPTRDKRQPSREIELHLTGNMHRYMWSINGIRHAEAPPIVLQYGERVRFILVNDTMMTHPFHLHGLWSELETGDPDFIPRKHTVLVQPGAKVSYLVTADAKGRWAYHCHMLYHMAGMMREVRVV